MLGARFVKDVVRAALLMREVERARWVEGPAPLLERLRARGMKAAPRSLREQRRLLGVVYRLDRLMNREPNCYRRSLVGVALDRDWAQEPVVLGLDLAASGPDGHAWVEGTEPSRGFDVEFRV
jgi:hypothetical protein